MIRDICIVGATIEAARTLASRCDIIGPNDYVRYVLPRSNSLDGLSPDLIVYDDGAVVETVATLSLGQWVAKNPIGILRMMPGRS